MNQKDKSLFQDALVSRIYIYINIFYYIRKNMTTKITKNVKNPAIKFSVKILLTKKP